MNADNTTITRNTRTILGPFVGVIRDIDDIINVDTTTGSIELYLQNIKGSGLMLNPRCIYINDIGGNVSTNNLVIYASGGDKINNTSFVTIDLDGANVKCNVSNLTEWTASVAGTGTSTTIYTDNSIFGNGDIMTPFGVRGIYQNILFVSPDGNNLIAQKGRQALAYQTLEAAQSAATPGDLIWVYPGNYYPTNSLGKNLVDWYFSPKASVFTNQITTWTDGGNSMSFKVFGSGYFQTEGSFSQRFLSITNNQSDISFEFNEVLSDIGITFWVQGKLRLKGLKHTETKQYGIRLQGSGSFNAEIEEIININSVGASYVRMNSVTTPGSSFLKFKSLVSNSGGVFAAITFFGCVADCKLYATGEIFHNNISNPNFIDGCLGVVSGGHLEFTGNCYSNHFGAVVYNGGTIVLKNSFVLSNSTGTYNRAINVNGATSWLKATSCTFKGPNTDGVVGVADFSISGDDGNILLEDCDIYCTAPSSGVGMKIGDNLNGIPYEIILKNVTFYNESNLGTPYSIATLGATSRNIKILSNCSGNTNIEIGKIINLISGTNFIQDSNVFLPSFNQ